MNPQLEALLKAFDAYEEASEKDRRGRWAIYQSWLDDVVERSGVSKEALHASVLHQHRQWAKAQNKKPPTLPPSA